MAEIESLRALPPAEVRQRIEALLAADLADADLRAGLEQLAPAAAFSGFTWLWGPEVYRTNRVLFRPFVLNNFSTTLFQWNGKWEAVRWQQHAPRLEAWLAEVDAADDAELFRRLYPWKHQTGRWGGLDEKQWLSELRSRFLAAETSAARHVVLRKFDFGGRLDEAAALELYRTDLAAAGPFVLNHLRGEWGEKRSLPQALFDAARAAGDEEFAFRLYRRQVGQKQWEADVARLAEEVQDDDALCGELDRRHPEGWGLETGLTLFRLIERRGRDVLPYLKKHLGSVYRHYWGSRDGYKKLVRLAVERGWWDLWSGLVRTCARPEEYNLEVNRLLADAAPPADEVEARLLALTGVSREWNFGPFSLAAVQQLDDATAVRLYERFPHLLRGPFKMHVSAGWHGSFPKLIERAIAAADEPLIDYLASRLVTRASYEWGGRWGKEQTGEADRLSRYYEAFRDDDAEFARRAVAVLGQTPAYSIWHYNQVIRTNRLARMFYERSAAKYLAHPAGVRDLLEAAEIHAQALAFRVLGLDAEAARTLAAENLDLLQATLLRPLHRKTRMLAFRALENAAATSEAAAIVDGRCREALDLPDKRYPKEQLVGLIGRLLHRWPELRGAREQPLVYGGA